MVMPGRWRCIADDRNCPEGDTAARLRQVWSGGLAGSKVCEVVWQLWSGGTPQRRVAEKAKYRPIVEASGATAQ